MERVFLPGTVVFHIECGEEVGTLYDLKSGERAYVNAEMVELIQHLAHDRTLDSFFPADIPRQQRIQLKRECTTVLYQLIAKGLLSEKKPDNLGLIKRVTAKPPLRVVFIELTKKCNLRCRHCYNADQSGNVNNIKDKQLSLDNILQLLAQIDEMGVMELQITGGEPFILDSALSIIREAQRRLLPLSVFTNGTLMSEDTFSYISDSNYGLIFYISLDGSQKIHDALRRCKGSFQRTTESIKRLIGIGCDVRINTVVGRHNVAEMCQFVEYVKNEFGVLHRLVTIEPIGRANTDMTISAEEFAALLQESGNSLEFLDSHDSSADWSTPACGVGSSMLFIDASGNVSFCPTLTQREDPMFLAGNVFHSPLKDIWENSVIFNEVRDFQCRKVGQCRFHELCKGGCRSRAYLATGDLNAPDRAMCLLYSTKQ